MADDNRIILDYDEVADLDDKILEEAKKKFQDLHILKLQLESYHHNLLRLLQLLLKSEHLVMHTYRIVLHRPRALHL